MVVLHSDEGGPLLSGFCFSVAPMQMSIGNPLDNATARAEIHRLMRSKQMK